MVRVFAAVVVVLACLAPLAPGQSPPPPPLVSAASAQVSSVDPALEDRIQAIERELSAVRSEVAGINSRLSRLLDRYEYAPSATSVASVPVQRGSVPAVSQYQPASPLHIASSGAVVYQSSPAPVIYAEPVFVQVSQPGPLRRLAGVLSCPLGGYR